MRLNKEKIANFKIDYQLSYKYIWQVLIAIAIISVILNTLISPALGIKALLIILVAVFTARQTEAMYYVIGKNDTHKKAMEKVAESNIKIAGLIFALLLPIGIPLFAVIISMAFAVVISFVAFGGFSHNVFNIAVIARLFAAISWPFSNTAYLTDADVISYILTLIFKLPPVEIYQGYQSIAYYPTHNFITASDPQVMLGAIPVFLLIIAFIYLVVRKAINYEITLMIIVLTAIMSFFISIYIDMTSVSYIIANCFVSMTLFGAIFIATDPITSPKSTRGRFVYAAIIVFVSLWIRELTTNPDGFLYAILFANMLVAIIDAKSGIYSNLKKAILLGIIFLMVIIGGLFIGYNQLEDEGKNKTTQYQTHITSSLKLGGTDA